MAAEKLKELQSRLSSLQPRSEDDINSKNKGKLLHQAVCQLQGKVDDLNSEMEYKTGTIIQNSRKLQKALQEIQQELQSREYTDRVRLDRLEKQMKKMVQRLQKQRKESEKKVHMSLQNNLLQLTSFRTRCNSSGGNSLRELREIEKAVEQCQKEFKNDVQLTKDILKKIHGQFRSQIDEISKALEEDRRGWQKHNETILNSWERMQGTMGAAIKESRQIREKGEGDVVDLLERVIDKIRIELMEQ